jgi:hypothetical protein
MTTTRTLPALDPVTVRVTPHSVNVCDVLVGKSSRDTLLLSVAHQHRSRFVSTMQREQPHCVDALDSLEAWLAVWRAAYTTPTPLTSKAPLVFTWGDGPIGGWFKAYSHSALPFEMAMLCVSCAVLRVGAAVVSLRTGAPARESTLRC